MYVQLSLKVVTKNYKSFSTDVTKISTDFFFGIGEESD